MRNLAFYILATITAVVLIFLLTRALGGGQSPQPLPQAEAGSPGELTIEDIREQDGLPAYWLGESYEGLPLINVQYVRDPGSPDGAFPPEERVTVVYASCKPGRPPEGSRVEGVCAEGEEPTFVSVTSEWLCLKPPSLLVRGARKGSLIELRGAQVQKTTSGNTHFHFGNSTVIIFASEGEEVTMEAFDHLVGVNAPGLASVSAVGSRLPPPVSEEACGDFVLPTPAPIRTAQPAETATPEPAVSPEPATTAPPEATTTPTPGGG